MCKNGSFSNKTCCSLTALFLKKKIYFCSFVIEQQFLVSFFHIDCSQYVEPKIFQKTFVVLEMELRIFEHLLKMSLYNITNWWTPFKSKIYLWIQNFISYQIIYMPPLLGKHFWVNFDFSETCCKTLLYP